MRRMLRLLVLAAVGGAVSGVGVYAFLRSLDAATTARLDTPWLVWLLPVGGAAVAALYHAIGGRARSGTAGVIAEATVLTHGAPARMAPLILAGSVASHAVGASVGREGGALQISASLTDSGSRLLRIPADDRRLLLAASLAGGWGAAFGVPVTGVVFAWRFARRQRLRTVPLSAVSALVGQWTVGALGYDLARPDPLDDTDWSLGLVATLFAAGIVFGLLARWFVWLLGRVRRHSARRLHNAALRGAVGGIAVLIVASVAGRDVLGMSLPLLDDALAGASIEWWIAPAKLVASALSLGAGFVGGDVMPLFVIGATAGAALAAVVGAEGARAVLVASVGSTVAYGAAASATVLGIVMSVERFGRHALLPAVIVAFVARGAAGRPGLYSAHH